MEASRFLNTVYVMLVRSMDDDERRAFDRSLLAPTVTIDPYEEVVEVADDWVPDWWIDDESEAMQAHQRELGKYEAS